MPTLRDLRAQIVARDTFLERLAGLLESRIAAVRAALDGATGGAAARDALSELESFSRELSLIARPDAVALEPGPVDLASVVREVVDGGRDRLRDRDRVVEVSAERAVRVACARGDVETVLMELLSNAAKYGKHRIEVRVDAKGSHGRLTVRDDGPGIPAAKRRRVLAKFVRGDGARPRTGFGIGLWLVREIARRYGGELELRRGELEVTLPLARA